MRGDCSVDIILTYTKTVVNACTGEDLNVGTSQNNYLAFEVRETSSGMGDNSSQGSLIIYWPGMPSAGNNGGSANVTWPLLTNVTVLGVSAVNPASVAVQVIRVPPFGCDSNRYMTAMVNCTAF